MKLTEMTKYSILGLVFFLFAACNDKGVSKKQEISKDQEISKEEAVSTTTEKYADPVARMTTYLTRASISLDANQMAQMQSLADEMLKAFPTPAERSTPAYKAAVKKFKANVKSQVLTADQIALIEKSLK